MQFLSNSASGDGGAIDSNFVAASITRSYFRENSAGQGASIYLSGATMNLSGDTFLRNIGGIYANNPGTLNVINSTFLGSSNAREAIGIGAANGSVTFSTISSADLSGNLIPLSLSNSILLDVSCIDVADKTGNLQFQSNGCPGDDADPKLDPALLKDNGGFTPTITLLAGSPALDAIPVGDCVDLSNEPLVIDQRDAVRPDPTNHNYCDTGAVESESKAVSGLIPPGTPFN